MNRTPLIGISGSIEPDESKQFILRDYLTATLAAGGIPLLLSVDMNEEQMETCLERLDGILLAGGGDVGPCLFGEAPHPALGMVAPLRDQFEIKLVKAAQRLSLPLLGICRGIQVMNVVAGGTLYQDLQAQYAEDHQRQAFLHSQTSPGQYPSHTVQWQAGSKFAGLFKHQPMAVNSFHHQAVRKLAPSLRASALSPDGVMEAMEDASLPFWLGVQWHPERMHGPNESALFVAFVQAAAQYAEGRLL